jgi:two-component system, chemotaxis family, chemotaxis protein CheY
VKLVTTPTVPTLTAIIVDDSDLMRVVISALLEKLGFEVIGEASDGREGVELAISLNPDLILLDVMMPKMNGYLALEEIIRSMVTPYVVMLSSVNEDKVVQQCIHVGAKGFIQKNIAAENILERLAHYCDALKAASASKP